MTDNLKSYPHYFKPLPAGTTHVDVYHVLRLFSVNDAPIAHAVKKLLCAGARGTKSRETDIKEAIASLQRELELDETAPDGEVYPAPGTDFYARLGKAFEMDRKDAKTRWLKATSLPQDEPV